MARATNQLSARKVSTITKPGFHGDGRNLYLKVDPTGSKSWSFRFMLNGKARTMGLGPVDDLTLKEAREAARQCRALLREGIDPIDERRHRRIEAGSHTLTFTECRERLVASKSAEWRNAKHKTQWENTLKAYADPVLGDMPVSAIDTDHVLRVLEPIWQEKTETATRVRQRLESVLDYATARKLREGENPARWRGHLDKLLAKPTKMKNVQHHPALPHAEMQPFMESLRANTSMAARALEFLILTATRTNEVIKATWDEIDLGKKVWTIPSSRMKAGREHEVPLSKEAISLLKSLPRESEYLFPGASAGKHLSNMAMLKLLKRLGRDDLTVHGFRSSFRDWCAESTNHPREVAEEALAHQLKDKAEAAYRRTSMLEKRRRLMQEWARYCEQPPATGKISRIRS